MNSISGLDQRNMAKAGLRLANELKIEQTLFQYHCTIRHCLIVLVAKVRASLTENVHRRSRNGIKVVIQAMVSA